MKPHKLEEKRLIISLITVFLICLLFSPLSVGAQGTITAVIESDSNGKTIIQGEDVTYTISLNNTSSSAITNVTGRAYIPEHTALSNSSNNFDNEDVAGGDAKGIGIDSNGKRFVHFNFGVIPANSVRKASFNVIVNSHIPLSVTQISATVLFDQGNANKTTIDSPDPAGVSVAAVDNLGLPDVVAHKSSDQGNAILKTGTPIVYTISVTNSDLRNATNVSIRDYIQEGTQYIFGTAKVNDARGSDSASAYKSVNSDEINRVDFVLSNVAPGETRSVSFKVVIRPVVGKSAIFIRNVGLFDNGNDIAPLPEDPDPGGHTNPIENGTFEYIKSATLSNGADADNATVREGQLINYRIKVVVSRLGMQGAKLSNVIPSGMALVPGSIHYKIGEGEMQSAPDPTDAKVIWPTMDLPEGESNFYYSAVVEKMEKGVRTAMIGGRASMSMGTIVYESSNNVQHAVIRGEATIEKTARIVNSSDAPGTEEEGTSYDQANPILVDEGYIVEYILRATYKGAEDDLSENLTITDNFSPGLEKITYTMGFSPGSNALSVVNPSSGSNNSVVWVIKSLRNNETATLKIRARIKSADVQSSFGTVKNDRLESLVYEAGAKAGQNIYPAEEITVSSRSVYHTSHNAPSVVSVSLRSTKKDGSGADNASLAEGSVVNYIIDITNSSPLNGVTLSNAVPVGMTYVPGSAKTGDSQPISAEAEANAVSGQPISWAELNLPAGTSSYSYQATVNKLNAGSVTANLTNNGANLSDHGTSNSVNHTVSQSKASITTSASVNGADLTSHDANNPKKVAAGTIITFRQIVSFSCEHGGKSGQLIISNPIPQGTSFVSVSEPVFSAGSSARAENTTGNNNGVSWKLFDMKNGETATLVFTIKTNESSAGSPASFSSSCALEDNTLAALKYEAGANAGNPVYTESTVSRVSESLYFSFLDTRPTTTPPAPAPTSQPISFFQLGPFKSAMLPGTGFSARHASLLPPQPKYIAHTPSGLELEIPTLNVHSVVVDVPNVDDTWQVAWLGDKAGLLSGSLLPGQGVSYIAGHNHVNTTAFGPFALIKDLKSNDRIFIRDDNENLLKFSVYANELVSPDDFKTVERIAAEKDNSLVLITCENELINGGYQHRRIIFAEPVKSN